MGSRLDWLAPQLPLKIPTPCYVGGASVRYPSPFAGYPLLDSLPRIERPATNTLVHGDLHGNQVLVNQQDEPTAVIDWGDVHIGDPAVDFAAVHAMLPCDVHEEFLRVYGTVDATAWAAARGRALWHTVALFAQAVDTGDVVTTVDAQSCLTRLIEG